MTLEKIKLATFAGGCFWCTESAFKNIKGVLGVVSGYTGGEIKKPSYEEVSSGGTGHKEAVQINYDSEVVAYDDLLEIYWRSIDPTDDDGQFNDRGDQYKTVIYFIDEEQKKLAELSKEKLALSGKYAKEIKTKILPYKNFYPAEEYHQDYSSKNPIRYEIYKSGSERKKFLKLVWGSEGKYKNNGKKEMELKNNLTPLQYEVTQKGATEDAFSNEYWNNKAEGIYVDRISGKPLFSSLDKYDSGSGWPSFTRPLRPENLFEKEDAKFNLNRTEVKSKFSDSHLGHVFSDGPKPSGLRYCINSASLRFVPKMDLEKEGYDEFKLLFGKK